MTRTRARGLIGVGLGCFASGRAFGGLGLEADEAGQFAVDAGDALNLAAGGKSLVKALVAESPDLLGPGSQALFPTLNAAFGGHFPIAWSLGIIVTLLLLLSISSRRGEH